jgi:glycosyltransferase involved in cell wall biosynthesis
LSKVDKKDVILIGGEGINILLVNAYYDPFIVGGAEVSTQKLAEGLSMKGHQVTVLCSGDADTEELIHGVKVLRVRNRCVKRPQRRNAKKLIYKTAEIYNPFNRMVYDKILERVNPELIHVNSLYNISTAIWKVAYDQNIPVIHTLRDYHLACPKSTFICKKGKPCHEKSMVCGTYRFMMKRLTKFVDYFTAPSKYTAARFYRLGYFQKNNYRVVPNAIDYNDKAFMELYQEKVSRKSNRVAFVFLGYLDKTKGLHLLLDAFQSIDNPEIELHIAGNGGLRDRVMQAAKEDIRIKVHGFLKEPEKDALLAKCDVLIVPSLVHETFGRVVLDGYKNVMPVIGTCQGGVPELIQSGSTGLVLPDISVETIKKSIEQFSSRENFQPMLQKIRSKLNEYRLEKQVNAFLGIYQSVKKKKEKGRT